MTGTTARTDQPAASDGVVNVSCVPQRSPFRYPGGKTWLVPLVGRWLGSRSRRPSSFLEPFAGGAAVGLSVVFDDLSDQCWLVERDDDVAAVWQAVTGGQAEELAARILSFEVTRANVRAALAGAAEDLADRAFRTVLRNRTRRGGILAAGAGLVKCGENGRGLASRWYPGTLARRLRDIAARADRIRFVHGDGFDLLREQGGDEQAVWFIDPPYPGAGRRLYSHAEIDHQELFRLAAGLRGDFLMTYDDNAFIRHLASVFGLATRTVAMKTAHHAIRSELLVGRDLRWLDGERPAAASRQGR